jgi:hypothetical protein
VPIQGALEAEDWFFATVGFLAETWRKMLEAFWRNDEIVRLNFGRPFCLQVGGCHVNALELVSVDHGESCNDSEALESGKIGPEATVSAGSFLICWKAGYLMAIDHEASLENFLAVSGFLVLLKQYVVRP